MKKLKIHIILPFPVTKPVGGPKIMYEYANRLSDRGHDVEIFHAIKRPFKKSSAPVFLKQLIFWLRGVSRPKWFPLRPEIKCHIVPEITDRYIPDGDIVFSTWWQMTYAIAELSNSKGRKFNLIQDIETWKGNEEKVIESYRLPVNHLVIARYLQDWVFEQSGKLPVHIPNAIDGNVFYVTHSIDNRDPKSLIMLYSEEPRKGTGYGLNVLKKIKSEFPDLKVILFGVYAEPSDLPEGFEYHQRPSDLISLYNRSSIFVSPSFGEGWALPPAEAMACGCAVVCTKIGGHLDYAIENKTALLFEAGNEHEMYQKLNMLLQNDSERKRLAQAGQELMQNQFSWNQSVSKLEHCFYESK